MAPKSQLTSELLQGALINTDKTMAYPFYVYFRNQEGTIDQGPTRIGDPISLTGQAASIGTTPVTSETLTAGLYRLTYYIRITTADGVSSSVRLNMAWVDGSATCTHSFLDVTGDTTGTTESETRMVDISAPPITFTVTYVSNTPGAMQYKLLIALESVAA